MEKETEVSEETIVLGKYVDDEEENEEQDTKVVNIITEDTKVEINEDTIVVDKIDDEKDI